MPQAKRLGIVAVAAVVAAAAFLVARPGGEDASQRPPAPDAADAGRDAAGRTAPGVEETASPREPARPGPVRLRFAAGRAAGGVRQIRVKTGDVVRLEARSDVPEELHVHGVDRSVALRPGRPGRLRFRADVEGVLEVEMERAGVQVAELRVEP